MLRITLLVSGILLLFTSVVEAKPKLLMPRLQARGVQSHEAKTISTALCHAVSKLKRYELVCSDDLAAMVKWNTRAAQLNACQRDDCMAEAAKAMQANLLISGSVSKVDSDYVLAASLIDVSSGKVKKRAELKRAGLSKLHDAVGEAALMLTKKK